MTRGIRWLIGLGLTVAGFSLAVVAAIPASATACAGVTIAQGQGLTFDVSSVLVTTGGCVRFANLTSVTVTVSVSGSSFSTRIPAKTPASASAAYTATKSGTITATDGIRTGHGTITVEAPEPTPSAVSVSAAVPIVSQSEADPMMMPTRAVIGAV